MESAIPEQQKHALIYYILNDCKPLAEHAETFAKKVYLPRKYRLLVSGLHSLDHGHAKQALELLTDPSLTPTFSDQILYTVLQNPKVDNTLAVAYNVTVSAPLEDPKTLDAYFAFLCDTNITQAYEFCQTRVASQRRELFENLILTTLSTKGDETASRTERLIELPFTQEEVLWFENFLLHGKGQSCHGAKDTVTMRRIATGEGAADISSLRM